tara:strand:+ start:233 stop:631 length:399 start_codon:yes stop_codon:yes gene_type:complete
MKNKIKFELITPSKILLDQDVEMVVIPGIEGYFGVLPEHASTLSALQSGVISIYEDDKVVSKSLIDGGVASVQPEGCYILAERAESVDKIDKEELQKRLDIATNNYNMTDDENEKSVALQEKKWIELIFSSI